MTTRNVAFDQMTQQEQLAAFAKWQQNQSNRRVNTTAKRSALTRLKALHEGEYNSLLQAEMTRLQNGGLPAEEEEDSN